VGDSMKRILLGVISLFAIGCVLWYFLSKTKTQPRSPDQSISQFQHSPAAKTTVYPDNTPVGGATPQVPATMPNQIPPNTHASNSSGPTTSAPVIELVSGDIEAETNVFKEVYVKRSRPIAINPQILEKDGKLAPGSRLNLTFFPDAKYSVTMQIVNRGPQGDISASGILDGEEYGTFSLSTASGVTLVRLADPTAHKLLLIRSYGPSKTHYALEMDPAKMPIPKHNDIM
jgi:hypothetical protein